MQSGRLRQRCRLAPGDAGAHGNLANALTLAGRPDEAATHYDTALRLNPAYAIAHENYGLLLLNRGQFQDAIVHFEAAVLAQRQKSDDRVRLDYAREQARRTGNPPGP